MTRRMDWFGWVLYGIAIFLTGTLLSIVPVFNLDRIEEGLTRWSDDLFERHWLVPEVLSPLEVPHRRWGLRAVWTVPAAKGPFAYVLLFDAARVMAHCGKDGFGTAGPKPAGARMPVAFFEGTSESCFLELENAGGWHIRYWLFRSDEGEHVFVHALPHRTRGME